MQKHQRTCKVKPTRPAKKAVSTTRSATAAKPTLRISFGIVLSPTEAIAIKRSQRELSDAMWMKISGMRLAERKTANATNPKTKNGIMGGWLSFSCLISANRLIATAAITIIGASITTLRSFTSVAMLPVSSETEKPAPTTCATS